MPLIKKIKPSFWDYHDVAAGPHSGLFNFRRKWKLIVVLTSIVALAPLVAMTLVDHKLMREAAESEIRLRMERLASNTRRTLSSFLEEKKAVINFIAGSNSFQDLADPKRLSAILENLKKEVGGVVDICLVDHTGVVAAYAGPHHLQGADFSQSKCFTRLLETGTYVSDLQADEKRGQTFVIGVKYHLADGRFYVLRTTLEAQPLFDLLAQLEMDESDDAFLANRDGFLNSPSRHHGDVFEKIPIPVPQYSEIVRVIDTEVESGEPIVLGYADIRDTPFVLMVIQKKAERLKPWLQMRAKRYGFLVISTIVVVCAILGLATFLVHRIHTADQRRVMALHQAEYTAKLASIGRLASGVAHEINNPLAVINEKAGLLKDLFTLKKQPLSPDKIDRLADDVIDAVHRCSDITRRLLNFARHVDTRVEMVNLADTIEEVLSFLTPEAARNRIEISTDVAPDLPDIESDRGCLQQIFLNLANNAFSAMPGGGHFRIRIQPKSDEDVVIIVSDTGCGIPPEDLQRVFEPFYTSRNTKNGTGLGLSITYGLVQEIGGSIGVESRLGEGTSFTITLPRQFTREDEGTVCDI